MRSVLASRAVARRLAPAALLVALVACAGTGDTSVASIALVDLGGEITSLREEAAGRPVLVSLWAVWCQPCKREIPVLDEIAVARPDIAVVAVNIGDDPDSVAEFVDQLSVRSTVVIDRDGDVLSALGAPSVPVTVLLDGDGEVTWKHVGAVDADTVWAAVREMSGTVQSPVEG